MQNLGFIIYFQVVANTHRYLNPNENTISLKEIACPLVLPGLQTKPEREDLDEKNILLEGSPG